MEYKILNIKHKNFDNCDAKYILVDLIINGEEKTRKVLLIFTIAFSNLHSSLNHETEQENLIKTTVNNFGGYILGELGDTFYFELAGTMFKLCNPKPDYVNDIYRD